MLRNSILSVVLGIFLFSAPLAAHASEPLEYQLATLNAGGYVPKDHITVARFRSLLTQLSATYVENKQQIADMSFTAQQQMRKDGINESLLNIMEGMNQLFTVRIENQKYAEYAAAYVTLRNSGQSHAQALGGLKALLQRLGVR